MNNRKTTTAKEVIAIVLPESGGDWERFGEDGIGTNCVEGYIEDCTVFPYIISSARSIDISS